jgi:bifunctional polynucleotide phosphatase/kinase
MSKNIDIIESFVGNILSYSEALMEWSETDGYLSGSLVMRTKVTTPIKIAAFDLDDTLIVRKTGKGKCEKWKATDPSLGEKLNDLSDHGYLIIVFSNQSGLEKASDAEKETWKTRVEKFFSEFLTVEHFHLGVYAAKRNDMYRKPNIGLWNTMRADLASYYNMDVVISKKSFFCGDAAGRIHPSILKKTHHPTGKKGDFADSDRKFAMNLGIKFQTPEEFYNLASDEEYQLSGFDPEKYLMNLEDCRSDFKPRRKELIVMIGRQGSGKSQYVKNMIEPEDYVVISQDICKSKAKCLKILKNALDEEKSIVIDNTNPDTESRAVWIKAAQEAGYKKIRAIEMITPENLSIHLDNVRHLYTKGGIPKMHKIAYHVYNKKYLKPSKKEGFDRLETVEFCLTDDLQRDKMWMRYFRRRS